MPHRVFRCVCDAKTVINCSPKTSDFQIKWQRSKVANYLVKFYSFVHFLAPEKSIRACITTFISFISYGYYLLTLFIRLLLQCLLFETPWETLWDACGIKCDKRIQNAHFRICTLHTFHNIKIRILLKDECNDKSKGRINSLGWKSLHLFNSTAFKVKGAANNWMLGIYKRAAKL